MRYYIVFLIFIFAGKLFTQSNTYNVPSREKVAEKNYNTYLIDKDTKIGISITKINSSSIFDMDGNVRTLFLDTNFLGQYARLYTIELEKLSFELFGSKSINENLIVELRLPISYYSSNEKYMELYDTINKQTLPRVDKANLDLFMVDYIEGKGIFKYLKGKFDLDFALSFRIPIHDEYGVAQNDREFWSNNAFEVLPEIRFGVNLEKFNFGMSLGYNIRTEDLKDRLLSRFYVGLYSIPDTYISTNFEWANSLISFDNALHFDVRKEPNMENYLETNILFGILLSESLGVDFSYKIRLLGKNSWNYFGYKIGLFYYL